MAGTIRSFKTVEIQAATTITAAETVIGSAIDTRNYDRMIIFFDYVNGDETSFKIIPKFLRVASGDEHQFADWSSADDAVLTQRTFILTASVKSYIVLDVRGMPMIKIYGDATGGSPSGTVQIGYSLVN